MAIFFFFRILLGTLFTLAAVVFFFWAFFLPYAWRVRFIKPIGMLWAKIMTYQILGLKVHKDLKDFDLSKRVGYISVSNHLSFLDIPVLSSSLHKMFLMKRSLLWTPFGWGAYLCGALSLTRNNAREQIHAIYSVVKISKTVEAMHLFPEGTRSKDGKLGPFKRGSLHKIYQEKLPVLALALWGTNLALPKNSLNFNPKVPIFLKVDSWVRPEDFSQFSDFQQAVTQAVQRALTACQIDFDHHFASKN